MSNFNSCIFEPPQPIPSHFMEVPASFSHSYFFLFLLNIFFYMYFFYFLWGTQKWITAILQKKFTTFWYNQIVSTSHHQLTYTKVYLIQKLSK
jgi:hypothetical protein